MPLNLNDDQPIGEDEKQEPLPILHKPTEGNSALTKVVIALFTIVVLGSIVFLIYQYKLIDWKKVTSQTPSSQAPVKPQATVVPTPSAPAQDTAAATPPPANPPVSVSEVPTQPVPGEEPPLRSKAFGSGKFTVYIAAFKQESVAAEESGRWNDAGFTSFVYHAMGWYRVALGRYSSPAIARRAAEEWKDSFEGGYWIGTAE